MNAAAFVPVERPASVMGPFATADQRQVAARLGIWVFLASEIMFFGPLFLAYTYARLRFPAAFALASRHTDVVLGTINTAVLLTSSLTTVLALDAARADARRTARTMLLLTALLGGAFLVLKGVEYGHDWSHHLVPGIAFDLPAVQPGAAQLFFYLYFAMTGLHALHLTIGVAMAVVFVLRLNRAHGAFPGHLEIGALYWHFVDAVWIFLYPMLYLVGRSG
jgi:cytochrome c oxidase subunit 3